jgi:alginate O-acetyltransferase complex protein AlgI
MDLSLLDGKFIVVLMFLAVARRYCPERRRAAFGALASAVVVGLGSVPTLLAIALTTMLYLYPVHLLFRRLKKRHAQVAASRALLGASLAGLALILVVFKVHRHFEAPFLGGPWLHSQFLALIGFSYFIFRAINFLHIQAILNLDERSPWSLLCFFLFPPTITSGPIQKFQDFRKQLASPAPLTGVSVVNAAYRITRGYFRKVVVAYLLNEAVERLLAAGTPNAYASLATILLLYLYFYYDFAGYSDVAIGFGALMGIQVPENFRKPFLATSVTEFWRNWHITLVDWFRDNVYIPLGGMQSGRLRASAIAFLIMVLCGLWHGLTLSFLAWGCWHGGILMAEGLAGSKPVPPARRHGPRYWSKVLWTNTRVALGAVFFLPDAKSAYMVLRGLTIWN